jgi:uncharacterized membrane protein
MRERLPWIDAARGGALLAMAAFHLTWDLAAFHWIDRAVVASKTFHLIGHGIAASFLLLSGVSLVLARRSRGVNLWRDRRYWRRWGQIVAAAGAVSVVSFQAFPDAPIFFGILHCIAASSLIGLAFVDAPVGVTIAAAAAVFSAPALFASPVFDQGALIWIGLGTVTPASNDFRPLLPWLGFVLMGVAAARRWLPRRQDSLSTHGSSTEGRPAMPFAANPRLERLERRRGLRPLAVLGRHALAVYLIHQPVLYGALALIGPRSPSGSEAVFIAQCVAQCSAAGAAASICEASCGCVVARAKIAGRWRELVAGPLTESQKAQAHDDAVACYADAAR